MRTVSLSAQEIAKLLSKGELTSEAVIASFLEEIERKNSTLNAFLLVDREAALGEAKKIDKRRKKGDLPHPWAGIPIAVKDNILVKGLKSTCSSKILENFVAPYNATAIEKLQCAGLVVLGKTNMDEFGMGSSNEYSAFGPVRNPVNHEYVPGGSSGGSAAAVKAGLAPLALGSDTGGSVRQPAALCGVVGLRPTYGLVSRYGLVAFASSLDQIGPVTKTVEECAVLLEIIAGHDPYDSTSSRINARGYTKELDRSLKGRKVGVPREYYQEGLDNEVREKVLSAVELLKEEGVGIADVSLPHTEKSIATYYVLCTAEASSNLARYDGVRYGLREKGGELLEGYILTRTQGLGAEVRRRVLLGTYVLSAGYYDAYYRRAMKVRTCIKEDFDKAFEKVDCLITPTSPTPAFRLGEKVEDPLLMYLSDVYTVSAPLAGLPAISIPCGESSSGLPIGLQIIGKAFDEQTVLNFAYILEKKLAIPEW